MKNKRYYYKFWLKSSRGTDEVTVRSYSYKPDRITLKGDIETWAQCFGAWSASENTISYGWVPMTKLPKNRKEALAKFTKLHKAYRVAMEKQKIAACLLRCIPFDRD